MSDNRLHNITPVILAGGQGRRLRPLTKAMPKPFLRVLSRRTLLQKALQRFPATKPLVITTLAHRNTAHKQAQAINTSVDVMAEPFGRSTGPAIAVASKLLEEDNAPMLVMPSDHYIEDDQIFRRAVCQAVDSLDHSPLVFIAAEAPRAEARYGYIVTDKGGDIQHFTEKPPRKLAEKLICQPHCYWNTGIFVTRPRHMLHLMRRHAAHIYDLAAKSFHNAERQNEDIIIKSEDYGMMRAEPIDRLIMENIDDAHVVPLQTYWSDVGTWPSLFALSWKVMRRKTQGVWRY